MKIHVTAPALAALAMFVFGAIYWMIFSPYKVPKTTAGGAIPGAGTW
jgi:hypothetical protein